MGYDTRFKGSIRIEPPADPTLMLAVNDYCRDENKERGGRFPAFGWGDWVVSADGATIGHDSGTEKSYEMEAWLRVLIRDFLAPAGRILNGSMLAQGEDVEDRWNLVVVNNEVSRVDDKPKTIQCPECRHKWVA